MGNPAMVKRKNSEKRRKKYEQRLGPGAYLPREERLAFNVEVEKAATAALCSEAQAERRAPSGPPRRRRSHTVGTRRRCPPVR